MNKETIKLAARNKTVEEALAHWQLAGGPEAGKSSEHWVSVAFQAARMGRAQFEP